jgi:hypothetical protein
MAATEPATSFRSNNHPGLPSPCLADPPEIALAEALPGTHHNRSCPPERHDSCPRRQRSPGLARGARMDKWLSDQRALSGRVSNSGYAAGSGMMHSGRGAVA